MATHSQLTFQAHFGKLEVYLQKAAKQKNPAKWLYKNNARTTLFMLEGLARLCKTMHNKKRFTKMQDLFKRLEDGLGAIDFNESLHTYCKANKGIPKNITTYFAEESNNNCDALNAYLADDFFESTGTVTKIKEKLETAEWLSEEACSEAIIQYYASQITKLQEWLQALPNGLDNMEEGVHELRRKLRWLSILPQALNGKVQLAPATTTPAKFTKYLTKEVIKSPFNKMPAKGKLKSVAMLNKNNFLALSWAIAELGNIKDNGQIQEALAVAYSAVNMQKLESCKAITDKYIAELIPTAKLLQQANQVATTFFKDKILEGLAK
jgi:hypothetical protein